MVCKIKIKIILNLFYLELLFLFFWSMEVSKNGKFYMKLDASINIWILKSKKKLDIFNY